MPVGAKTILKELNCEATPPAKTEETLTICQEGQYINIGNVHVRFAKTGRKSEWKAVPAKCSYRAVRNLKSALSDAHGLTHALLRVDEFFRKASGERLESVDAA